MDNCNEQMKEIDKLKYSLTGKEEIEVLKNGVIANLKDEIKQMKNGMKDLVLAIYDVYFEKKDVNLLMRKYKLFRTREDALNFINNYNQSKYTPNREIIHFEIQVVPWGYKWIDINDYHNKMIENGKYQD